VTISAGSLPSSTRLAVPPGYRGLAMKTTPLFLSRI
jgi:hypothetical protein